LRSQAKIKGTSSRLDQQDAAKSMSDL